MNPTDDALTITYETHQGHVFEHHPCGLSIYAGPAPVDILQAVLDAVPPEAGFGTSDLQQMQRLLTACMMTIEDAGSHPAEVKRHLTGLANGYGCWLDTIRRAIDTADIPDPRDRARLSGAFGMAKAFLFDIQGYNPTPLKA